ncbi:MAG: XdhC family protein [Hyphomicrobiales bacterium]
MELELLSRLNEMRSKRIAVIVATDMTDGSQSGKGRQRLFVRGEISDDEPLNDELNARFLSGKSGSVGEVFLAVYLPPPRLVIIGAVHISQHMVGLAQAAGFDVSVIDPRTAFASPERFPNVTLHAEWPDEILNDQPLDSYTALAALTHDPKIDDVPLEAALHAGCFYVGALGGRKTNEKRIARLRSSGVSDDQLARIDAPIGLDIGATSPAEIAVAVLGSVIANLRGKA